MNQICDLGGAKKKKKKKKKLNLGLKVLWRKMCGLFPCIPILRGLYLFFLAVKGVFYYEICDR